MKTSGLRVLQIIGNLNTGGAQEVVRTLAEYLALRDCVPIVCTFRDGPLRREIEQLGVEVIVLPGRRYSIVALPFFIADMARILRVLAELIERYNVDVIQTHLLSALDFLVLLLRYTTRVRVILWTFHNVNFALEKSDLPRYKWLLKPKRYVHNLLYRLTSPLISGFIAVSDEVKESMVQVIGPIADKITVICNGVDTKRYGHRVDRAEIRTRLGLKADTRLLAIVATLKEQKGHRYMVEAMSDLVPQHPDAHALFIGDGTLREELQVQVERLGLDHHIHFLGNRSDVPELLAASDVFVLPSLWEGLAMALLEAMATGLPIVATKVSGTIQVLVPNQTGILVQPGDAGQLAQAIGHLLKDPLQTQRMGMAAKRCAEDEFSAQKQADEHLALYNRLLQTEVKRCQDC
jgi:glycosyltransferase involved in cell wall biosynthesis